MCVRERKREGESERACVCVRERKRWVGWDLGAGAVAVRAGLGARAHRERKVGARVEFDLQRGVALVPAERLNFLGGWVSRWRLELWVLGFRVWGLGFGVLSLGFWIECLQKYSPEEQPVRFAQSSASAPHSPSICGQL